MTSLFATITNNLQTLKANQEAISVVQQNVANANTDGYHRQIITMASTATYSSISTSSGVTSTGTGVTVASINRVSNDLYDSRYRTATSKANYYSAINSTLSEIETVLDETGDDGLLTMMDDFWVSWETLNSDPTNTSYRSDLYSTSVELAEAINWRYSELTDARSDLDLSITQDVQSINDYADQLAELNSQISSASAGGTEPSDLLDQRDQILDKLSELTSITYSLQDDGSVSISLNGHTLVEGTEAFKLETYSDTTNDGLIAIQWEDGESYTPTSGEIAGLIEARDGELKDQIDSLNDLASTLISSVNALHTTGYDLNGDVGEDFFSGTDASDIAVNSNLSDVNLIAASSTSGTSGDGTIATQIAALQNSLIMNGGTTTFNDYYNEQITNLGLAVSSSETQATSYENVADTIDTLRESSYGVSLDEEAANLTKYQSAYEAAARVMTVIDEMLDTLINGMGVG